MRRWKMLGVVTVAFALEALTALGVAPLAPFLLESLQLSRAQVGLFLPAIYLGGVVMALPAGWLVDRLGVRRTLLIAQTLTGSMVALAAVMPTVPLMLACLVVAGFGFSAMNPATGRAVVDWFAPTERGAAMGVKQTGLTLGGIGAALLLPPLALTLGWRDALAAGGAVSVLSAGVVAVAYRNPPSARGRAPTPWPRLAEVAGFLRRPGLLVVFGCGFVLSIVQASMLAYLTLFAKEIFLVSAVTAGQLLAIAQAGGTIGRLGWGVISDRWFGGRRRPGVIVTALVGAGAYVLFALAGWLPFWAAGPLAFVAGVGAFGWVGLYFALVAEIGGARYAGLLTGVAVTFAWSGVLAGPLLFGGILHATGTYVAPWLVLAVAAATAAFTLAQLRPLVQRDAPRPERVVDTMSAALEPAQRASTGGGG